MYGKIILNYFVLPLGLLLHDNSFKQIRQADFGAVVSFNSDAFQVRACTFQYTCTCGCHYPRSTCTKGADVGPSPAWMLYGFFWVSTGVHL
jgi:hypothetical protein